MKILPITLTLVLAGCSAQAARLAYTAPARMEPTDIEISIEYVERDRLAAACGLASERLVGCSKNYNDKFCMIFVAWGIDEKLAREVLEHEKAHCYGWRHPHDQE